MGDKANAISAAVLAASAAHVTILASGTITVQALRRDEDQHIRESANTAPLPTLQEAEQAPPPVEVFATGLSMALRLGQCVATVS